MRTRTFVILLLSALFFSLFASYSCSRGYKRKTPPNTSREAPSRETRKNAPDDEERNEKRDEDDSSSRSRQNDDEDDDEEPARSGRRRPFRGDDDKVDDDEGSSRSNRHSVRQNEDGGASRSGRRRSTRQDEDDEDTTGRIKEPKRNNDSKVLTPKELYKKCSPAVFTIKLPKKQGSGFFIKSDGLAVTNNHVLSQGNAQIKLENDVCYDVQQILYTNPTDDVTIFRVNVKDKVPYLHLSHRKLEITDRVYAIGSPRGLENSFSMGRVSQFRPINLIQIDITMDKGSSGGALLNKYGEVVGITTGMAPKTNADLNYAKKIELVLDYLGW